MGKTKTVVHPGKIIYVDRPTTEQHDHLHQHQAGTDLSKIDKTLAEKNGVAAADKYKIMLIDISDLEDFDYWVPYFIIIRFSLCT